MVSKQERSLTWKYFFEQKEKEIGKALIILFYTCLLIIVLIYVPLFIGNSIGDNKSKYCGDNGKYGYGTDYGTDYEYECTTMQTWLQGFLYLLVSIIFIGLFIFWIMCNWYKAVNNAKRDIRNIKKGSRKR